MPVSQTVAPKLTTIALTSLTLDPRLQPRLRMDDDLMREYVNAMARGDMFPPIRVIADKDHSWLVNGWHRVKAAKYLHREDLPAEVTTGTFEDAEDYVLAANATHGLRRTQADVQNVIRRALLTQRWVKRSDTWISKHIGCDHKTVTTQRERLESTGEIPRLARLLGEDGKARMRPKPAPKPAPEKPQIPDRSVNPPESSRPAVINDARQQERESSRPADPARAETTIGVPTGVHRKGVSHTPRQRFSWPS